MWEQFTEGLSTGLLLLLFPVFIVLLAASVYAGLHYKRVWLPPVVMAAATVGVMLLSGAYDLGNVPLVFGILLVQMLLAALLSMFANIAKRHLKS
ncbi:hypothetical protein [Brevibacillus massiliensis]|jgi:drug/metabolite transporter (DMT)-like permease|uniref:hypothetical protein n=1 Tax=Brevibacillus massiliensis TaxID=1118054 RepID=UPI0002EDB60F|nr:hypothetical protein [Brevibacillus massiliensis]